MKSYQVVIEPAAWKQIMTLPSHAQEQILSAIEQLEKDARPAGCKKLVNTANAYRIRSGDYRVVYQVQDAQLIILVLKIGHRRDVYKQK